MKTLLISWCLFVASCAMTILSLWSTGWQPSWSSMICVCCNGWSFALCMVYTKDYMEEVSA